jgi:hypothetical protein
MIGIYGKLCGALYNCAKEHKLQRQYIQESLDFVDPQLTH